MKNSLILLFFISLFSSCEKAREVGMVSGMVPIYSDPDDASGIKSSEAIPFGNLGGIVERGKYIYLTERGKGIHVVDNSDPSDPKRIRFWEVPGISLFTLDEDRLYADNGVHLWVIDITDIYRIKVVDKQENTFNYSSNRAAHRPPDTYSGYFECTDFSKGIIIGWERKTIVNPRCQTI